MSDINENDDPDPTNKTVTELVEVEESNEDKSKPLILRFPLEIIGFILAQMALDSPNDFMNLMTIGIDFCIPYNSSLFWEPICYYTYPELAEGKIDVDAYGGYYNLFRKRPVIRFNGVYICIAKYSRCGESTGISFNPPRHVVTYFRYLWLNSDGTARSLLSNSSPKVVLGVGCIPSEDVFKDVMHGRWALNPDTGVVCISVDGGLKRKLFFNYELEVASSGGKCHNKLKWRRYWCVDYDTFEECDFMLKNEASYYFCKL